MQLLSMQKWSKVVIIQHIEYLPLGIELPLKLECKINIRILLDDVKYSMRNLICDVIYPSGFDMGIILNECV